MTSSIERILLNEKEIQKRVGELALTISTDYKERELLLIGILKGAVLFLADLVRCMDIAVKIDFMAVSSYGVSTRSSGVVRITKDLEQGLENRNVLIVEDIVDTGLTLAYLLENLQTRRPASLQTCVLLDKPSRRKVNITPDYCGFQIPDDFVVGYGLDYGELYRNLPYIGVLRQDACD